MGRQGQNTKEDKGTQATGGLQDIRQWFEKGGKPSQTTPERKKGCGSKELQQKKSHEKVTRQSQLRVGSRDERKFSCVAGAPRESSEAPS